MTDENLEAISAAADEFVKGDDKMKIHRQLFVATRLLDKKKALPKVLEMTQAAVSGVDSALDVPNPSAAVMADELYETRTLAMSRNEILIVPEIPRQTLSVILRGRIEEITGWTLYHKQTCRSRYSLNRFSVTGKKARVGSTCGIGNGAEADGNQKEALANYIKAYTNSEQPDASKYFVIESLYQKVNGSTEGLEQKIGVKPAGITDAIAKATENPDAAPTGTSNANQETKSNVKPENPPSPQPSPESTTETSTQINAETAPTPKTEEAKTDVQETPAPATDSAETKSEERGKLLNPKKAVPERLLKLKVCNTETRQSAPDLRNARRPGKFGEPKRKLNQSNDQPTARPSFGKNGNPPVEANQLRLRTKKTGVTHAVHKEVYWIIRKKKKMPKLMTRADTGASRRRRHPQKSGKNFRRSYGKIRAENSENSGRYIEKISDTSEFKTDVRAGKY